MRHAGDTHDARVTLLTRAWQPTHFFVGRGLRCAWEFEATETMPWEIFRGRLLDASQTRARRTFTTWNLRRVEAGVVGEPILSLLLDVANGDVFVTRGLVMRVWAPTDASGVVETRETIRTVRELVASLSADALAEEIAQAIRDAIVGTSRLPLASSETPLPEFVVGRLFYASHDSPTPERPTTDWRDLLDRAPDDAKVAELVLRAASDDELDEAYARLGSLPGPEPRWRTMMNDLSLSPYTTFVDRALDALSAWAASGAISTEGDVDGWAWFARRLCRHLNAYDLVTFHYRGANYPDALALDAALARLRARADASPGAFAGPESRLRRRGLRQALIARRLCEGQAVPDHPTSPGENLRVMPAPLPPPTPEEQILEPRRRTRRLFADDPLAAWSPKSAVVREALLDLGDDAELRELGTALFIDRPLGFAKAPAEADRTPLVSAVAFSRRLAQQRLDTARALSDAWGVDLAPGFWAGRTAALATLVVPGVPASEVPESPRPAVSFADARRSADDFVYMRTTPRTRAEFWRAFDASALAADPASAWPLFLRVSTDAGSELRFFRPDGSVALALDADLSRGYVVRRGVELPAAGLTTTQGQSIPCR